MIEELKAVEGDATVLNFMGFGFKWRHVELKLRWKQCHVNMFTVKISDIKMTKIESQFEYNSRSEILMQFEKKSLYLPTDRVLNLQNMFS